jgi:hypothetical protein
VSMDLSRHDDHPLESNVISRGVDLALTDPVSRSSSSMSEWKMCLCASGVPPSTIGSNTVDEVLRNPIFDY